MKTQVLRQHAHCVFRIFYHIVFVTKYRRKVLTPSMIEDARAIFAKICESHDCKLLEMNGESDHVHLLIDATPNIQPSKLVNALKTISSRELRKKYTRHVAFFYKKPVLWHRSYCILSAGGAPLETLRRYIENQGG